MLSIWTSPKICPKRVRQSVNSDHNILITPAEWKKKVKSKLFPLLNKNQGFQTTTQSYYLIAFAFIFV